MSQNTPSHPHEAYEQHFDVETVADALVEGLFTWLSHEGIQKT